jgi:hypothetical protein
LSLQLSSRRVWGPGSTLHLLSLCWIGISVLLTKSCTAGIERVPQQLSATSSLVRTSSILSCTLTGSSETSTAPWAGFDIVDPCDAVTVDLLDNVGQVYFRRTYLYPALETQRLAGDPDLVAFDGGPGNSNPSTFWSLHCYRRAARTQVSLSSEGRLRKASSA